MIFSQNWIHTWGGRFNKTDTLLLVAGVLDQVNSPPIFKLPICISWISSSCQNVFHESLQVANMYLVRLLGWSLCWTQATTQYSGPLRTVRTMLWELGSREVQMLTWMLKLGSRVKHLCLFCFELNFCILGDMIDFDFDDEDAEEPSAMVQLNMVRGRDVQPVQRNILKIRW